MQVIMEGLLMLPSSSVTTSENVIENVSKVCLTISLPMLLPCKRAFTSIKNNNNNDSNNNV